LTPSLICTSNNEMGYNFLILHYLIIIKDSSFTEQAGAHGNG